MTVIPAAERADLHPDSPQWGEHRGRYHFAAPRVAGKLVLDMACGTGYGASILMAAGAKGVLGVDLSWDALSVCRSTQRMLFCAADGTSLPLPAGALDAVTSFETVEHIREYPRFVSEIHRVLKPGGLLIMSTPNALHTKPVNGVPRNPYHVREFTPDEFRELLAPHFPAISILGQRPSSAHRPCPYWEGSEPQPDVRSRAVAVVWKIAARLPRTIRERFWRLWRGVSFHPGEHDFDFTAEGVQKAHVLVAVCER